MRGPCIFNHGIVDLFVTTDRTHAGKVWSGQGCVVRLMCMPRGILLPYCSSSHDPSIREMYDQSSVVEMMRICGAGGARPC